MAIVNGRIIVFSRGQNPGKPHFSIIYTYAMVNGTKRPSYEERTKDTLAAKVPQRQVIFGKDEEPWAEQYKFGWTIIDRVCKDKQRMQSSASVNRVTVERETLLDHSKETSRSPPLENVTNTKGLTSPKQVHEMMELDYSEIHHSRKIRGKPNKPSL